ncbi:MAG: hypothetical protein IJ679_06810 [Lachnospiraceae bacterium]|nr:hypothetical protein [Lachnospiraceae bacterium]
MAQSRSRNRLLLWLKHTYYSDIRKKRDILSYARTNAIKGAYELAMAKVGIKPDKSGHLRASRFSSYLYLQCIYLYQGAPSSKYESLLAIDEVRGISPEELRLLYNINGKKVVFNLYGDIHQHIEGTKGVDSWEEYKGIIDFYKYEMQENYRNASQITEYCNKIFDMKMNAINTPGKGVHEIKGKEDFRAEMITQLMDNQRAGLAAILVGNVAEARYLMDAFSSYDQKFHDMTDVDFSIHLTRWNIIHIDDAKGLEFSSVIVLSGRMSRNQRYIAYTRALDDLYVYSEIIDVKDYEKESEKDLEKSSEVDGREVTTTRKYTKK